VSSQRFAGRRALVTGAGSGVGQATAVGLAREGADLVLLGRRGELLEQTAQQVRAEGVAVAVISADVRDETAVDAAFDQAGTAGPIDLMVTSAGINAPGPLVDAETDTLRAIIDVNVLGLLFCCRAFGRLRGGSNAPAAVVCVSSQMGSVGYPGRVPYCASKHAVNGLTKALALEWAPSGVRVNAVAPTFLETPLTAPMFADGPFREEVVSRIPLGRIGTVPEVVGSILFLLSDEASLITGHVLAVDGGWTAI
jgi:NAD(P)-dependent dehydrogenase (short-subunit alcohol dehydrogenase family)